MDEKSARVVVPTVAMTDLSAEFAYRLDHCQGRGLEELFMHDGRYSIDQNDLVGREAIREAYRARASFGVRTVRHLFVNFRIQRLSETDCEQHSVMVLYGSDGAPVLPVSAPLAISDVHDHLVHSADGWKFQSRSIRTVFRGDAKVVSPHSAIEEERKSRNGP